MQDESLNLDSDLSIIQNEHSEVKNSFVNWDTSATPCKVLGRKIHSAAMLSNNTESICRYPLPVQITNCKPKRVAKRQFQDISNRPRSSTSKHGQKSKTPEPGPSKPSKPSEPKKSIQLKASKKPSRPIQIFKPTAKKTKISVEIPLSLNENSVVKKNINSIVMQTLKKQKIQKRKEELSKNEEKIRQNQIKKHLKELNKNTRVENFNKFKQEKFHPVCPWGTDERRITRVNDVKILKDAEELRKKRREERERSKSAGKSRIGLDIVKVKKDLSRVEAEEDPPHKKTREKDRSILEFMKKQKIQRQRSKELQIEKAREEENKRLMQLLELEKLTRPHVKRNKSQKSMKKKLNKKLSSESYTDSEYNDSEDDEVMNILHGRQTESPDSFEIHPSIHSFDFKQSGRECRVFGVFPEALTLESKANVTQIVNDIVEKRTKAEEKLPAASATMPLSEVKSAYSALQTEEEFKDSVSSDISKRKEELRKKLSELRSRVDRAKKHESQDFDEKARAATRIQAWVRGWLTRIAIQRYLQEQESDNWLYHEAQYSGSDYDEDSRVDAERSETESLTQSPAEYNRKNPGFQVKQKKKQQEVEFILKTQAEWRLIQKQKLGLLKNKDLEDMRAIATNVGSEEYLMKHLEDMIHRRYQLIEQLFDENIEAVKLAVKQAIEDNDRESLLQTLEKQENFMSEIFQNLENNDEMEEFMKLKHQFDFKNIWNYSDNGEQSIRISELEFESPSGRTVSENLQIKSQESARSVEFASSGIVETLGNMQKIGESLDSSPTSELDLENIVFNKPSSNTSQACICPEPVSTIFEDDVLGILEDLIGQELYWETIDEAWEVILTSSSFINSVAENILIKLLDSESRYLDSIQVSLKFKEKLNEKTQLSLSPQAMVPALKLESLKPVGIFKDDEFILQYIRQLFDYLLQVKFDIETLLNVSNLLDPLELLGKMQEAEIGVFIEKNHNSRILPLHLYIELEQEPAEPTPLQELQHIHNKLLFDVVSELLQKRCIKPSPLPWTFEIQLRPIKKIYLNNILGDLIEEIKDLNKTQAGKTPKVEFIINSQDSEEDIAAQMREEQLSSILANEVISQEPCWVNYEFEETQVKLDLSDMTLEELVEETVNILNFSN